MSIHIGYSALQVAVSPALFLTPVRRLSSGRYLITATLLYPRGLSTVSSPRFLILEPIPSRLEIRIKVGTILPVVHAYLAFLWHAMAVLWLIMPVHGNVMPRQVMPWQPMAFAIANHGVKA